MKTYRVYKTDNYFIEVHVNDIHEAIDMALNDKDLDLDWDFIDSKYQIKQTGKDELI